MKKYLLIILILAIIIFTSSTCKKDPDNNHPEPPPAPSIALVNGSLFDGVHLGLIPDAVIIIQEGYIKSVGTTSTLEIPSGAEIIDVQGLYILPGFMNAHVHSGYTESNLKEWARTGVTSVRDVGNFSSTPEQGFIERKTLMKDTMNARLIAAGPLVTTVGGYGNYAVTSPADAIQKIQGLINSGADIIKIAIEDNLQGKLWPLLSMDEITAIVQTTHNNNTRVSAHISRSHHLYMAIQGDVDDVCHMVIDNLPDSLIEMMIQQNMYWVSTLELWKGVSDMYGINWDEMAKDNLRRFVEAGGKVATGTDFDGYITPFQLGMPMLEMQLMQEAGMTNEQIIIAGTRNAAYVSNMENQLGTIEPDKMADIIVVSGNPLNNLESLLDIRIVIHNGRIIRDER